MEMPWQSIINFLLFISAVVPLLLSAIYVMRRITTQSELCSAISNNKISQVRAIMLTYSHFLRTSQRNNANMYLMSNGDPLKAGTKEIEESNNRSDYCAY